MTQTSQMKKVKILDEIIDNAAVLPLESQDFLLMIAKAMRHTRDSVIKQYAIDQSSKPPEQTA